MLISLLRSFLKQSRFVHLTPNKGCSVSPSLSSRIQTLEVFQLLPSLRIHTESHLWGFRHSSQGFHLCPGNAHRLHTSLLLSSDYRLLKRGAATQLSPACPVLPHPRAAPGPVDVGSPAESLDASFFDLLFQLNIRSLELIKHLDCHGPCWSPGPTLSRYIMLGNRGQREGVTHPRSNSRWESRGPVLDLSRSWATKPWFWWPPPPGPAPALPNPDMWSGALR